MSKSQTIYPNDGAKDAVMQPAFDCLPQSAAVSLAAQAAAALFPTHELVHIVEASEHVCQPSHLQAETEPGQHTLLSCQESAMQGIRINCCGVLLQMSDRGPVRDQGHHPAGAETAHV